MANKPYFFENLHLNNDKGNNGIEIIVEGTFKFLITEVNGKEHTIKNKNSC
jgi:hypothetical protein